MPVEAKIKAKDLSYDSTLPPFLQRLHAANSGRGDPDRHERQLARPKRVKDLDQDDEPTVVDENGETVSLKELENRAKDDQRDETVEGSVISEVVGNGEPGASGALQRRQGETSRSETKVTDGTVAPRKRKVAKVIGDDEGKDRFADKERSNDFSQKSSENKKKKPKRTVKLTFDDEAET